MSLFPEYDEGNGKRRKPTALTFIIDHVEDEDGDGATTITEDAVSFQAEDIKGLHGVLAWALEALNKPVLNHEDF